MKLLYIWATIFCLFFLYSCNLLHILSIKKANEEDTYLMNSYLRKIAIDTNYSYRLCCSYKDSLKTSGYSMNKYKLSVGGKSSALQIRMYDSLGNFIYGWEQCFGDLAKSKILDSIPFKQNGQIPINSNLSFNTDIQLFDIDREQKAELLKQMKQNEFTIVVMWAGWVGWFNKTMLRQINKYVKKHRKKHKILFLKLHTNIKCDKNRVALY